MSKLYANAVSCANVKCEKLAYHRTLCLSIDRVVKAATGRHTQRSRRDKMEGILRLCCLTLLSPC